MEQSYIEKHLLVDDYLAGALSDQELAQFEERLLWDQDLVAEVAFAEALRKGLRDSKPRESGVAVAADPVRRAVRGWPSRYAVAATMLLAVSLTFNIIQSVDSSSDGTDTRFDGGVPQVLRLVAARGPESAEFPVDPRGTVVLTIDPLPGFDDYRLSLTTPDSAQPIAVESGIRARSAQPLAMSVPGSALPPGDYQLMLAGAVSGADDYRTLSEVRFRVAALQ